MGMAQKLLEDAMEVENYSPQVERLLVEWEQDRAVAGVSVCHNSEPTWRAPAKPSRKRPARGSLRRLERSL
jgi:hypothetical protein